MSDDLTASECERLLSDLYVCAQFDAIMRGYMGHGLLAPLTSSFRPHLPHPARMLGKHGALQQIDQALLERALEEMARLETFSFHALARNLGVGDERSLNAIREYALASGVIVPVCRARKGKHYRFVREVFAEPWVSLQVAHYWSMLAKSYSAKVSGLADSLRREIETLSQVQSHWALSLDELDSEKRKEEPAPKARAESRAERRLGRRAVAANA